MLTVKNKSKSIVGRGNTIIATINRMPIGKTESVAILRDFAYVNESKTVILAILPLSGNFRKASFVPFWIEKKMKNIGTKYALFDNGIGMEFEFEKF